MTLKQYNWKDGPDLIQQHSVAKHRILEAYLAAYFRTLVSSPNQDVLKLTLVDGFAGGGPYVHNDTREPVKGSPFIFLEATREAEFLINKDRRKHVQLQVDYFFTEADRHAHMHLDKVLREAGHGDRIGNGIYIDHARFQDKADAIIEFIRKKSPSEPLPSLSFQDSGRSTYEFIGEQKAEFFNGPLKYFLTSFRNSSA